MLILDDGSTFGLISGGCLEEEIACEAQRVLASGSAVLRSYGLEDTENLLGFGTGCNGRVDVLITGDGESLVCIEGAMEKRMAGVMVQVIGGKSPLGQFSWYDGSSEPAADRQLGDPFPQQVRLKAAAVMQSRRTSVIQLPEMEVLVEYVQPPIRLVICGSGPDVQPLVRVANVLGWPVVVVGHQPVAKLKKRFPKASKHVFLMHASELTRYVSLDVRSAVVIMNHNLDRDRATLASALDSEAGYIGLLGPRARNAKLKAEAFPSEQPENAFGRVFGPAGLDTGAETPAEIALAICSEIQTAMNGRTGTFLRDGTGAIHAQ